MLKQKVVCIFMIEDVLVAKPPLTLMQDDGIRLPARPFVKWAGGKRQLISTLDTNLPDEFGTYFEPFLGGGTLFFHILARRHPQRCSISDLNHNLIMTYTTIRDNVDDLISSLKNHQKNYRENPKEYYYLVRQSDPQNQVEKSSRLLFLNRTCYNGLYRVNSQGKFNVPFGRYSNPNIVNESKIRSVSKVLRSEDILIRHRDFKMVLDDAKKNDLVYFDPPYVSVSSTANFTSYTNNGFTRDDLCRLAELCYKLDRQGCKVLLSNSDSETVSELFSRPPWKIMRIRASRMINSNSKKRSGHHELLIKNY